MYDLWAFRYLDYAVQMGFFYVSPRLLEVFRGMLQLCEAPAQQRVGEIMSRV